MQHTGQVHAGVMVSMADHSMGIAAAVGPDPDLAAELTALGRDEVGARRWTQAADRLMAAAAPSPELQVQAAQ